ncbi:putative protein-serine/threonine phosphatase [Rosa chinensis]|uniref:PPM-type phosphatase domain-containing protein n=1 Tax=Rosa chinensis TaxID=74649 RepID=A0A2P6P674_ROSCH|nr:putative protein-serine/threonine phosphatase [Rosa chinensis]
MFLGDDDDGFPTHLLQFYLHRKFRFCPRLLHNKYSPMNVDYYGKISECIAMWLGRKCCWTSYRSSFPAAGGRVIDWKGCRVLGVLATSRSIGDHYLKPYVISEPEVTISKRTGSSDFLVIASDGLWDVVSNEFACQVVTRCLDAQIKLKFSEGMSGGPAENATALLAQLALARGSKDNITVIVVELKKSMTA